MTQHTPGPWYWVKYPKTKTIRLMGQKQLIVMDFVRWGMQSAQPRFIRIVPRGMELMINAENIDVDTDPNARLIAAAPELLAACEELVSHHDDGPWLGISIESILGRARAAIARARGE